MIRNINNIDDMSPDLTVEEAENGSYV